MLRNMKLVLRKAGERQGLDMKDMPRDPTPDLCEQDAKY